MTATFSVEILADQYNATQQAVADAIEASKLRGSSNVLLEVRSPALWDSLSELLADECERSNENVAGYYQRSEYHGVDCDGHRWTVTLWCVWE